MAIPLDLRNRHREQALKNTLYFYSFKKQYEELLRKAFRSSSSPRRNVGLGVLQRSLVPFRRLGPLCHEGRICYSADVGTHVHTAIRRGPVGSPAPAMPFALAMDGKKLMSGFFQLQGSWVQEVASAAAAVVTDAELQMDVKIIGRAYALQAAQFAMVMTQIHTHRRNRHGSWRDGKGGALDASQLHTRYRYTLFAAVKHGARRTETATPGRYRRRQRRKAGRESLPHAPQQSS